MMLNGIARIVLSLCIFLSVTLGQDEENKVGTDKCRSPPPIFRNMSSCCEIPDLIEESVLEECGIPLDQGLRFWLHGPGPSPHHHHRGHGKLQHHGAPGEHGCTGFVPHDHHGHGPYDGPRREHGGPDGGPHGPPPGAGREPAEAEGLPTTVSTLEAEWPNSGEKSSVEDDDEPKSQLRRVRRYAPPHHRGHGRHHRGPPPCDKERCIFRKLNLLDESEKVDKDAFAAWLDQLAASDVAWSGAKDAVVNECVSETGLSHQPFGVCEPLHLLVCTTGHLFKDCPEEKWSADEKCSALKTHINDCHGPKTK